MNKELVELLKRNARYSDDELASMLGSTPEKIRAEIKELEKQGIILGYQAIVNEQKIDVNSVVAIVKVDVVPAANLGFDEVAKRIASHREVESVYLLSGGHDLQVIIKVKNLQEVANFVGKKIATIDAVTNTTTTFILNQFKENGIIFTDSSDDERRQIPV